MAPKTNPLNTDFTKFFKDMKLPAVPDVDTLMNAHRRNLEALAGANRVALEGAQAVARRHMEIMQQSMTELTGTMKTLAATETPQEKAAKQAELLKEVYQKAVANMREMADLIQHANTEAMDEAKTLMKKAEPGA